MKWRALALATLALAVYSLAGAADPATVVEPEMGYSAAIEAFFTLMSEQNRGMQVLDAPSVDIIVARIEDDGEVVTACVHDWSAARDFIRSRHQAAQADAGEEK